MVNFVKKRLQVFISSTYIDLIEERQAAVEAILSAGHISAGMELFAAGDESQMQVIKQWIDESDVYLLILGGRYGSIEPKSGKSYIHLEYEYALDKGIALFSCVLQDADARATRLGDIAKYIERENPKQYKEFRELVQSEKIVRYWSDAKDIQLAIMQTLQNFSRRDDLAGWVRGDQQVDLAKITPEIIRLSEENARLRDQLSQGKAETSEFEGLSYEEMKHILKGTKIKDGILIKYADRSTICTDGEIKNLLDYFWQFKEHFYLPIDLVSHLHYFYECYVHTLKDDSKKLSDENFRKLYEEDHKNFNILLSRGLLQQKELERKGQSAYKLSNAGLRFLNKLELEKSRENQNNDKIFN